MEGITRSGLHGGNYTEKITRTDIHGKIHGRIHGRTYTERNIWKAM